MRPDGGGPGTERDAEVTRMIGIVGWAVLFALIVVWEGIGLRFPHDAWPTLSDMLRVVMRTPVGRWAMFGVWVWLGWHVFIRGWHLFLRA